ncbi:uncharacterized protein LOC132062204 [Lycium ferocissimum]|uniref:uncharacterized protein LOC132062204 n=1 Tax=Lycium ferocissimum TaxID=112874 RepID=UPI002816957C|nr:uncharacterized protein LOC132062204 [Lycium ferocissimum]
MVLIEFGLPNRMVEWVITCVTTVSYSLVINGGLTERFQAKKGLRQGDPMSPYLFVLVMEYLNRSLKQLRYDPNFNYHPKCSRQELVHICFADDLIMCCRADKGSIQLMMKAFEHFSSVSGLQANLDKSSFYVAGVTDEFRDQILQEMRFTLGEIPFKYLGVPLSSRKLTIQQCMPLVEKIIARIRCWSSKLLSYSGSNESSRKALVAWDNMCLPKAAGGLNIINFEQWNKAAICKLLWSLSHKKDTLWVQWIHSFYIKTRNLADLVTPKQACWLVRKIFDARKWFPNTDPITHLAQFSVGGRFSIKQAYFSFIPQLPRVPWRNLVQSKGALPRHRLLLASDCKIDWLRIDGCKWGVQVSQSCVLCNTLEVETMEHLFFGCRYSRFVWHTLLHWVGLQRRIGTWAEEIGWLSKAVNNNRPRANILGFIATATVYTIWVERNARRFQAKARSNVQLIRDIILQLHSRGQNQSKWSRMLHSLNSYPV